MGQSDDPFSALSAVLTFLRCVMIKPGRDHESAAKNGAASCSASATANKGDFRCITLFSFDSAAPLIDKISWPGEDQFSRKISGGDRQIGAKASSNLTLTAMLTPHRGADIFLRHNSLFGSDVRLDPFQCGRINALDAQ